MVKHPGRVLFEDFMTPMKITPSRLAKHMEVNRSTIGRLIDGSQRMTPEMAARLGACLDVPARWWLLMQAEFDAREVAARPELVEGVTPLQIDPDLLLTPTGVLHLGAPEDAEPEPPVSILCEALETLPCVPSAPERRKVRIVSYESGSVALVGDTP